LQIYDLTGKVILVTGAASGLGEAMAKALLKSGASVLALDVNDDRISQSFARIAGGGRGRAMKFDVRNAEHCAAAVSLARNELGGIHGLVNCAGIGMPHLRPDYHTRPLRFWEADPQKWQDVVDINMRGPFLLARAAAPFMIEQKWGRIVNVTTSFNTMIRGANMPYGQTKAGLEAASASWSEDLKDSGVTVNVLVPGGAADTGLIPADSPYDRSKLISPAVMETPICWLMSDQSSGVTGKRFIGQQWDAELSWQDAMARSGSGVAWPELAAAAAAAGQPVPKGGFKA
jgi:NAD(P)-dependent dehydrogenase (short-subunit alcohol dehydrogenase family)